MVIILQMIPVVPLLRFSQMYCNRSMFRSMTRSGNIRECFRSSFVVSPVRTRMLRIPKFLPIRISVINRSPMMHTSFLSTPVLRRIPSIISRLGLPMTFGFTLVAAVIAAVAWEHKSSSRQPVPTPYSRQ